MKQRVLVAVVGAPALIAVLCAAPGWATVILLVALCAIGGHELLTAVCSKELATRWCGLTGLMGMMVILETYCRILQPEFAGFCMVVLVLLVISVFVYAVAFYGKPTAITFQELCVIFVAGLVIPLAMGCLMRLRLMTYGAGLVMIPLVAAFCSDTAALFTGMACGRHKLAPLASPKKTVEGALGGLAGGMLGMVIFRIVFQLVTSYPLHIGWCLLVGLLGAAMGQLGDLSFSIIKRQYGIKDYGRLLPGHGGVLDRFDSVIFVAPVVWLIISSVQM